MKSTPKQVCVCVCVRACVSGVCVSVCVCAVLCAVSVYSTVVFTAVSEAKIKMSLEGQMMKQMPHLLYDQTPTVTIVTPCQIATPTRCVRDGPTQLPIIARYIPRPWIPLDTEMSRILQEPDHHRNESERH